MPIVFEEVCDVAPAETKRNRAAVLRLILRIISKRNSKSKNISIDKFADNFVIKIKDRGTHICFSAQYDLHSY